MGGDSKSNLRSNIPRIVPIYALWVTSWVFAGSLFEVYFFNLGMSIHELMGTSVFWFLGSLIMAPFIRKIDTRKFMIAGISIGALSAILLWLFPVPEAAYAYRFLLGLTHLTFWAPFNIMFYEFRKGNNAVLGSLYYSIGPALMLTLPGIAGFLAQNFGYALIYAGAAFFYALTFASVLLFKGHKCYECDLVGSLKSINGLKSLIFVEGFSASIIVSVLLETMLLKYVSNPLGFGAFVSLTTVFAIAASFITSKFSDMKKRRREFLLLSAALFGASAIFTSVSWDIATFFAGFAAVNFFKTIFFPLPFALAVDNSKDLVATMIGREYMLNFGRILGAIVAFAMMFYVDIKSVLFVFGMLLLFACPIIFEIKKSKLEKI